MIDLRRMFVTIALLVSIASCSSSAQVPSSTATADETSGPSAPSLQEPGAWRTGPVNIKGMIDGYYSLNFNHPRNDINALRNFDDKAEKIELNMALLTVDRSPKPVGVHFDIGAGRAFETMNTTEKDATGMRFFEQAYFDAKPVSMKGLELDFGKFTSWASAEVIETPNNWNYSRSLLFVWCTPYYHFGVRGTRPLGKNFNTGIQLVSGWNNIITGATYRTVGLTASWTPTPRVTWTNTYYGGPDENAADRGMRNLYDAVLELAGNARASAYLNIDYLHDSPRHSPSYAVYGVAGAASLQLSRKLSLSPRLEWLNDNSGMATGTGQQMEEITMTGRYALLDRLSGWVEFRNDWSNRPYFNRGDQVAISKSQPTVLVGMVAIIRPKR